MSRLYNIIMRNARQDVAQARIKIARRNISNIRDADDTTVMAESEEEPGNDDEEELKNLLMKEHLTLKKLSWQLVPSLHGK